MIQVIKLLLLINKDNLKKLIDNKKKNEKYFNLAIKKKMIFFSLIKKIFNYKIVCKLKKKKMNHFLIQLENNLRHVIDLITIMADATNTIQRTYENQQFRIIQVIINLAGEIQMIQNGVQETFFQNLYQTQQDIDANEDFEVSQ